MPPKKRGKQVQCRDSQYSRTSFDRLRFWDALVAENYSKLQEKNMQRERGMNQSFPIADALILAQHLHWAEFVKPPTDAVMSLVREFYANLMVRHEDYHVRIRGKMVAFDSKTINSLYSMPDYENDDYTRFMREPYPYETIMNRLCDPGTVWKLNNQRAPVTFPATCLIREAYNWYHFVAARMMPSGHVSDVTKKKAALVYCIVTGKKVDAGRVIMNSILQAAQGTSTVSMPHSSTITELCRLAGVIWDDSEPVLHKKGDILVHGRLRGEKRRRHIQSGPGEASGSGAQAQPARHARHAGQAPAETGQSKDQRLDDLERMMRRQWQMTREQFDYVHDFNRVLAQRFPATSASDEPFPNPPTFSHRPVEDDFQYDEDEDVELSGEDSES